LPAGIFTQRKHGFSIPVHEWFRNELYSFAHDLLTSRSFADSGYFSKRYIEDMLSDHKRGRRDSGYQLWSLVCFQLWREEVYAA
jgi:asparagine synthase (glutamine-hydrolysing)